MRSTLILVLILIFSYTAFAGVYTVRPGDTVSGLISEYYTGDEIAFIAAELKKQAPGFVLRTGMRVEQNLDTFSLQVSVDKEVHIYREDGEVKVAAVSYDEDLMPTIVSGTINSTLFEAVRSIGESPELAASLARIFEWEMDFFRDIRPGDTFTVLVEKRFINNKYVGYGRILSADFNVKGKNHKAYLYKDGKRFAYYNEKGLALERGFLRVPLSYARITSRFSDARMHPVLHEVRPHYGVDYAAPIGTPVMVTASGTITRMSNTRANGNFVEVRHSNGYKTYYLHLSRFNKKFREGSSVNQGDVIAYVGSTGYSTGPHLDYRIQRDGRWLNPLSFIAESPKMKEDNKAEFLALADRYNKIMFSQSKYVGLMRAVYMP